MKRMHFTAALLVLGARAASAQPAAGPEFLVDSYTTGAHANPALAADAHGNFVAVWERDGAVFGQRFTAGGVRRGAEFEVSPSGSSPKVAASAAGAFVVSWHASGVDGSGAGVQARRFDASGTPLGGALAVNTYTTGNQGAPAIAADAAGNFVVAWQSAGQDGGGYGVFARRFDAAGGALADEAQVSSSVFGPFGDQSQPALAAQADGSFVVAWNSRFSFFGGSEYRAVLARRYDAAGAAIGGEFAVTESTATRPSGPDVALDGAGNFVVAWSETFGGFPLPSGTVVARRFDASGTPLSATFGVPEASFSQGGASVAMDLAGNFTIAWLSRAQEGAQFEHGVYAQRFDAAGTRVGGEFRVNTYTTGDQRSAAVVSGPDENFTVLWQGPREGVDVQVLGQRYGDVIFRDGFPAEGLGRWSAAATDGGDLQVSAAAALDGSPTGLAAVVDDTASLFVQDETPTAEALYRAAFFFDPNGFDPGEAQSHLRTRLFIGFDSANRRAFALVLRRRNGDYALMARVRLSDGGRAETGFVPLTDEPHLVEVLYAAETAPGAGNGGLLLTVDNVVVAVLDPLDMGAPIERVRLGALSVKGGAAGSLLFDGFDSRRSP